MSTLELEHLKHSSASGNNITLAADGSVTVDTTTLKVDATNNRVGVGTTSPGYPLQVNGSVDILNVKGSTGNAFVRFTDSDATADFSIGADDGSYAGSGSFILYDRSNGAYRLAVNSNGHVTKPSQPSFHAYRGSGQSVSGQVVFQFDSTLHNIGSHYNTSTYQFTAPVAGSYFFSFKSLLYNMDTGEYFDLYPQVNGVNRRRYELTGNGGGHTQVDYSDVFYLNAGDTVRMTGSDRSSGSYSLYGNENHFSGFLLG